MSTVAKREAEVREFPRERLTSVSRYSSGSSTLFNRELSLLEFHRRVLEEALDETNPLLERLKFLSIFAANIDEFFMIRVSGLKEEFEENVTELSPDGMTPEQQLREIRQRLLPLVDLQMQCLAKDVLPRLNRVGISVVTYETLTTHEKNGLKKYFDEKVFPLLTPLAVDPSHPFPYISPLSVNIALMVDVPDEPSPDLPKSKLDSRFVRIKVPSAVPRLVPVGFSNSKFILLEDVIEANIQSLFPGMTPGSCHRFRVTRDADIEIREEEAEDLLHHLQRELRQRRFGAPVRLEISAGMPQEMIEYLSESLALERDDVYLVEGPLQLQDFMSLYELDRPDLKDAPFQPNVPEWFSSRSSIFESIQQRERLLHHPYDSYDCVTQFIDEAVEDEDVLAIKICLYRTGPDSPIPPALIRASEKGKQVTALIELKARFDEEHNIEWARKLDEAGVHVVYGVLGLKTHGKLTLVVRREGDSLKRYVHIASGNYNPTTSCTYTDLGLFTADEETGRDATELFNFLTGSSRQTEYRKLFVAPVNLREKLNALFDREIEHKRAGRPAGIVAKLNRLADPAIIDKLYQVSQAGVPINLIVRGICMLRPGIEGLSENIKVRSVVGRFLEHSRVLSLENGGDQEVYIGSADWMSRNLKHRIEVVTPVVDAESKRFLRETLLAAYLGDNIKARALQPDGSYAPLHSQGQERFEAQSYFMRGDELEP
ncbi:MAG TPA: polyphosphate kinase 1 [Pyrinomonadaceae bacterium]|nr:polyphosphate kinase 1 [Pyrinomonadaceae bacterium]